jgi:predicted TIM-barrel enzyme
MDLSGTFGTDSPLIGMVHLAPLPGAPRYDGSRQTIRGEAFTDALTLVEGGFDGLLVENYGDTPYYPEEVPAHVVAKLAATARELAVATDVPLGVRSCETTQKRRCRLPRLLVARSFA